MINGVFVHSILEGPSSRTPNTRRFVGAIGRRRHFGADTRPHLPKCLWSADVRFVALLQKCTYSFNSLASGRTVEARVCTCELDYSLQNGGGFVLNFLPLTGD